MSRASNQTLTLAELVDYLAQCGLSASIQGQPEANVSAINSLQKARSGELTFLSDKKFLADLSKTQAEAVLLKPIHAEACPTNAILVDNPYAAYAYMAQKLYMQAPAPAIHNSASIDLTAKLPPSVTIGAHAVIGAGVELGEQVVIGAGCVVEANVKIGARSVLAPNVTIMHGCEIGEDCRLESGVVIGGDGFGWANHQGNWIKIPQIGRVLIGNRVSIGNNTAIDRGAIDDTIIEDNCIIDNLVHIAHNVVIGSGTAIAGQVGFAGSAKVGKNCTFAGQAGMVGHIELVDGVTIMGRSVATHSIHQPGVYAGFPAVPMAEWQKNAIYSKNLAKMSDKLKHFTQRVAEIEQKIT